MIRFDSTDLNGKQNYVSKCDCFRLSKVCCNCLLYVISGTHSIALFEKVCLAHKIFETNDEPKVHTMEL
jgi:hypothetical protein